MYVNSYECPCGETWEDRSECTNNDRCPSCNKEIEPYQSGDCCFYCGGNCPNEPEDSPHLCDGFAGDIDGLYKDV
jgi:hypothetical protein